MGKQLSINDDACLSLANRLNQLGSENGEIMEIVTGLDKACEDLDYLNETMDFNNIVKGYFANLSKALKATTPGIQSVATQLKNAAEASAMLKETAEAELTKF